MLLKVSSVGSSNTHVRNYIGSGLRAAVLGSAFFIGCSRLEKSKEADSTNHTISAAKTNTRQESRFQNLAVGIVPLVGIKPNEANKKPNYPETKKIPVKENWHGTEIIDNYLWLENLNEDVVNWTTKQNALTKEILNTVPNRETLKAEVKKLFEDGSISNISVLGSKQFQWRRTSDQNHRVLYVKDIRTNKEEVVLDPNLMSTDGTKAIDWTELSKDGKLIAYGISDGGTEKSTLKIKNVETKQDLSDEIPNTRACSIAWLQDNSGFYYTRYPEAGSVPPGEENYHRKVYFHKIGTSYKEDPLVFEPKDPLYWTQLETSEDGKWLVFTVLRSFAANDVYLAKVQDKVDKLKLVPLFVDKENKMLSVEIFNNQVYMFTDFQAPKGKVMRVSLDELDLTNTSKWEEIIKEETGILENFQIAGGKLVLYYQEKAHSRLDILDIKSRKRDVVPLPTLGSIMDADIKGRQDSSELFYSFESFASPTAIYKVNLNNLKQEKADELKVGVDLADIETNQVVYKSKDGTNVTMFLIHKKGLEKNRENKVQLYGYGGFAVSMTPAYMRSAVPWIQKGGIFAVANIRGGNEYGEDWHKAGMLDKKQNVFDDFIAAAEYLIKEGYTKPEKLAIRGGSNGGLLVAAVLTQRPDLFGAVVCQVPLTDMIHYDRTHVAKLWRSEYGDPAKPEQFKFLYEYSPYHKVKEDVSYPPVLFLTAEGDSRVDPMHARKMAARLQAASSSDKPVLLFVDKQAGHGAGKPINKTLDEIIDIYCFLEATLK